MLIITYATCKDAEAAKMEFSDMLPGYNVTNLPASITVGECNCICTGKASVIS